MVVRTKRKQRKVKQQESKQEEQIMLKCFDCDCVLPEDSFNRSSEGIQCPCCHSLNVRDVNAI